MKYYLIAGEASGDLHGSNLMKEIKQRDPEAIFRCWGGELMQNQGGFLVKHYKELAFMGFAEVLLHLPTILGNLKSCRKDISQFQPDVIILIDYPGFNLRLAKFAHQAGFRVVYYISPQVWAWKKSRVYTIRKVVDKMIAILPFEKSFYAHYQFDVDYVGHPLLDVIDNVEFTSIGKGEKPIIALLPGSRKQEIKRVLPIFLSVIPAFPAYHFKIAAAPGIEPGFYRAMLKDNTVELVVGKTYELLGTASAALVTSGTASLETALFQVPQVICYKGSALSYAIARRLVKVKYIGLPNLIMNKEIIRELIQDKLDTVKLTHELNLLLTDQSKINQIKKDYLQLKQLLGGKGASGRAADVILRLLKQTP